MDGVDDMPGLLYPVVFVEIGVEFSSFEPEPVDEYIALLEVGYKAAHKANPNVIVGHCAFLTTNVFRNNPTSLESYEAAFASDPTHIVHSYQDHVQLLSRPDIFDVFNIHSLNYPLEIERIVKWLAFESNKLGYSKKFIISDTLTTSFIGWGPATICNAASNLMGEMLWPATESQRCHISQYFQKLVKKDAAALEWVQGFASEDTVKRLIVAAEQGAMLINTWSAEDLELFKTPLFFAAAGNSIWGGQLDVANSQVRASFYGLQQVMFYLQNSTNIERITNVTLESGEVLTDLEFTRLYRINQRNGAAVLVAWHDKPEGVLVYGDSSPKATVLCPKSLLGGGSKLTIFRLIW